MSCGAFLAGSPPFLNSLDVVRDLRLRWNLEPMMPRVDLNVSCVPGVRRSGGVIYALPILVWVGLLCSLPAPALAAAITIDFIAGDGCSASVTDSTYSTTCTGITLGAVTNVSAEGSPTTLKLSLDSAGTLPANQGAGAQVNVFDTFTVTGGSGSGTLVWNWALDGTLNVGDTTFAELYLYHDGSTVADFRACGDNVPNSGFLCFFPLDASVTVDAVVSVGTPFLFGVPRNGSWSLGGLIFGPGPVDGAIDFFNTAQLQPLVVLDSTGAQVSGVSVLSDSGFSYAVAGAAPTTVPEPGSLLLLGTGLVGLVAGRRRLRAPRA